MLLIWIPAFAAAQDQEASPEQEQEQATAGGDATTERARELFGEGIALAGDRNFGEAALRFREAYALVQAPNIAYNLAVALVELGELTEASELVQAVLADPDAPDTPGDVLPDAPTDTSADVTPCSDDMLPDGGCTDFTRDPFNCGGLGTVCVDSQVCTAGACMCRPGLADAGGCVDLQTDPTNCGRIGTVCGSTCREGSCASSCGPLDRCGDACLDLSEGGNVFHCGRCDRACAVGQVCANMRCRGFTIAPGCTTCPCPACPDGNRCCEYPGAGDAICVNGNGMCS